MRASPLSIESNIIFSKKKILLNDIGLVQFRYSKKAKNLRIVINHYSSLYVVIPYCYTINDAIAFVQSKKDWIHKNKIKLARKILLKMDLTSLELENFWDNSRQKMIFLANFHKLKFHKLVFKTLKSKWGSCTRNNIICINNMIYYLPEQLQEYIMLHELMHTKIKNHSNLFWQELEKICPNSKLKRKQLIDDYAIE